MFWTMSKLGKFMDVIEKKIVFSSFLLRSVVEFIKQQGDSTLDEFGLAQLHVETGKVE